MPAPSGDESSDSNEELNINNEYAKNYNQWRQKEELNRLKQRYGEDACNFDNLSEVSSESSEDDDEVEVPEKFEEDFYKVLALLKSEDPRIHDEKVSFFDEENEQNENSKKKKPKKEKAITLRDFERKIVLERGGKYCDSEDESGPQIENENGLTYVQEQDRIKNSFKAALDDNEDDGDLLVIKSKSEEQIRKEETRKKWLKGQDVEVDPKDKALKPIRDFWANPNLDAGEKFLRDYILDKKYLDKNASDAYLEYDHVVHNSDENLSEDEEDINRQEEFEYKYNFRFEEPDQEFIKRYPRILENSMRKKDSRRAEKRAELKTRKEQEKLRKKEELKELRALKRKDIEEKLEKLKEITGNDDIMLNMADLEGDFDPNEYDRKMQEMFNDQYYTVPEDDMKPQFPEIDEEINAELPFNNYENNEEGGGDNYEEGPDCEDPNFIMDADYDPTADLKSNDPNSKKKKKKGRNSELLHKKKPKFDPKIYSTYQEYIDHYYSLDYEDMIDDIPCRFKFRKTLPNDYGLTIEEIFMADDKELNKWCSLKKALEYKSEEAERNEFRRFQQKAQNEALKRKILPSLYRNLEEEAESQEIGSEKPTKKRKRKKKKEAAVRNKENDIEIDSGIPSSSKSNQSLSENVNNVENKSSESLILKSKKRKHEDISKQEIEKIGVQKKKEDSSNEFVNTLSIKEEVPKKKFKKKYQNKSSDKNTKIEALSEIEEEANNNKEKVEKKKIKKEYQHESLNENINTEALNEIEREANNNKEKVKKKKIKKEYQNENSVIDNEKKKMLNGTEEAVDNKNTNKEHKEKKKKKTQQNISTSEIKKKTSTGDEAIQEKIESDESVLKNVNKKLLILEKKQKYIKLKKELAKKNAKKKKEVSTKDEANIAKNLHQSEKLKKKEESRLRKLERKHMFFNIKKELVKKNEKNTKRNDTDVLNSLSADRLKAFGANPKKFKNKLKYGNH